MTITREPQVEPAAAASNVGAHMLLVLGVFACSTAVILIKASTLPAAILASYRLAVAAVLLTPTFVVARRAAGMSIASLLARSAPGALFLAGHFITWAWGARATNAANASLIVNLSPVAMPVILLLTGSELISRREIVGTLIAVAGVLVLCMKGLRFDPKTAPGDAVCFISMLLFTCYLAVARRGRGDRSIWLYTVPLYWVASAVCLVVAVIGGVRPLLPSSGREGLLILGLGVIPTVIGHSILNRCMQGLRAQTVMVFNLCQFIFARLLTWLLWNEIPAPRLWVASVLVIAGVLTTLRGPTAVPADEVPE